MKRSKEKKKGKELIIPVEGISVCFFCFFIGCDTMRAWKRKKKKISQLNLGAGLGWERTWSITRRGCLELELAFRAVGMPVAIKCM